MIGTHVDIVLSSYQQGYVFFLASKSDINEFKLTETDIKQLDKVITEHVEFNNLGKQKSVLKAQPVLKVY